ncbi:MAG: phosphatidylserine decarboxylase [Mycobacteriaceae bacterium]|nr:phosphatidylserine decarboxylase [Mycobacteriaceae bacterium]
MARRPRPPATELNPVEQVASRESEASRLIELIRSTIPPMHRGGLPFVSAGLAAAVVGGRHRLVRNAGLTAAGACAFFFRNPTRVPPQRPGVVVAPADGQFTIVDTALPPAELGLPAAPMPRVSIFLSLFNAHVQWVPVGGEVVAVRHRPGQHGAADRARSTVENERNSVLIRTPEGHHVVVVQIAGVLARRIVCDLQAGDKVSIGDSYGLIRFGSRLDTYLPAGSEVLVAPGQHAVGAETVIAELP